MLLGIFGKPIRILLHVPIGMFNAWALAKTPHIGWAFLLMFVLYEINEDWHIKDQAWYDLRGWLWGFVVGAVVMAFLGR